MQCGKRFRQAIAMQGVSARFHPLWKPAAERAIDGDDKRGERELRKHRF